RISIASAFGNPREVDRPFVFEIQILIGVWEPCPRGTNIVRVIGSHPKSPSHQEPWAISSGENERHQVWNKQIGLPQNKQTRVKIDLKLVHRAFVTDRRPDTGSFNLKSVVLWIAMRKASDKKRKGPIPAWLRIRDREQFRNRQRLADGCRRRHLVHQPHDNRTQHYDRELSEFGMRAWHSLSVVDPANA